MVTDMYTSQWSSVIAILSIFPTRFWANTVDICLRVLGVFFWSLSVGSITNRGEQKLALGSKLAHSKLFRNAFVKL